MQKVRHLKILEYYAKEGVSLPTYYLYVAHYIMYCVVLVTQSAPLPHYGFRALKSTVT